MADNDDLKKKKKKEEGGIGPWMLTYGDMVTLLLCFFVLLMNPVAIDGKRLELIMMAFNGLGPLAGGNTLEVGELAELGHSVMSMPSKKTGRGLDKERQTAVSLFKPEIFSEKVKITEDERGLVITLAGDVLFEPASAELNMEESREILQKLARLLSDQSMASRMFRIEGHTDTMGTDPDGDWPSNWELSVIRSANVLHYLADFGVRENQFQISGFGGTKPLIFPDNTVEAKAYNRRVDVIILTEGHL